MPIKFRLDEIMKQKHLTYEQVNKGANVSTSTLYNMRRNRQRQVGVDVMGRLIDFFDCDPGELIVRVKDEH